MGPDAWLSDMFTTKSNGDRRITKLLRKGISWRCESWLAPLESNDWLAAVGGKFDIILGRHGPFFYPDTAQQRKLLAFCASALDKNGFLVIGRDESSHFAKTISGAAPTLSQMPRPACICGAGPRLPPACFRTKRARGPASQNCMTCAPHVGKPGKMVWQ